MFSGAIETFTKMDNIQCHKAISKKFQENFPNIWNLCPRLLKKSQYHILQF